jgi:hypothetical protein
MAHSSSRAKPSTGTNYKIGVSESSSDTQKLGETAIDRIQPLNFDSLSYFVS